ncbi:hypothetical protein HMPREF1042_1672 [Streptococcus constellatus subsp. pharyngis SK1060 = CCUG 46377]|uniref:ABC transporter domain-containing protein n=1 Tax=Streptococcus constellatus subsp. pharyngis SK1060 = CCUG 46377 TaxID=1035184 RepID=F9P725_STRCV|nr:hypothetical protein HMPREF1042_1672 [Streptococcus constellatus subsp. pharyngis SK1060 = CCUG 46377]
MTILKMDSVSYQYNSLQENVLNQITASFEEGKFYAIIGKSGAGKSTLLSLLAGLDTPTKGKSSLKIKTSPKKAITITDGNKSPWFSKIII